MKNKKFIEMGLSGTGAGYGYGSGDGVGDGYGDGGENNFHELLAEDLERVKL